MALQKAISSEYGFDNTYWRLQRLEIHRDTLIVYIVVAGWLDQAARLSGKRAHQITIELRAPDSAPFFQAIPNVNLETFCYAFLKNNTPDFSGASDV